MRQRCRQCGIGCGSSDPSLHVGANIIPFLIDPGAAYYANIESYWRAESPTINCTGKSNINVSFNYIMEGQPALILPPLLTMRNYMVLL
jgi:hypothetical protein